MIKPIGSQQNPNYKRWRQIIEPRGIKKFSQTLVSGRKIIPEMLHQRPDLIKEVLIETEQSVLEWGLSAQENIYLLERAHFNELDIFGTHAPLLVMEVPQSQIWVEASDPEGLELVIALSDPANLGALFRSAEAFGASKVILLKEAAHAFHPKVTKTSSGSNFRIPIEQGPSIFEISASQSLWALDKKGANVKSQKLPQDLRLLIGQEGQGVPSNIPFNQKLSIPMKDSLESLNAVVAASVAIFCWKSSSF